VEARSRIIERLKDGPILESELYRISYPEVEHEQFREVMEQLRKEGLLDRQLLVRVSLKEKNPEDNPLWKGDK
jgi:hypothetical protein